MIRKLNFDSDERGVSEVIGAILVFGILVVLLGIIQTQAIPAANEQVEFNHNQEVQSDLTQLQESVSQVVRDGNRQSVSVSLGTTYPTRLFFFNPPNPSGTIRSTERRSAVIEGDTADIQSSNGDVNERIQNVNTGGDLNFEFRSLQYEPVYNEYRNPPTIVNEYGILYLDSGDDQVLMNEGSVVDGREVSLVSTAGELDLSSSGSRSLSVEAAPAPSKTVPIEHASPGPGNTIDITLPTGLGQSQWDEILAGQVNDVVVDSTANKVTISLPSVDASGNPIEYQVEAPRFEVDNSAPNPTPTYVTFSGDGTKSVTSGQSVEVNAEVRDRFNNPIPEEEVTFELVDPSGTVVDTETVTSDAQGVATAEFSSPPDGSTVTIDATSILDPTLGESSVSIVVGSPIGPVVVAGTDISREDDEVELDLRNDGIQPTEINRIQLESAVQSLPSGVDTDTDSCTGGTSLDCPTVEEGPEEIRRVSAFGETDTSVVAEDGEEPQPVNLGGNQISAGATETVTLEMNPSSINDGDAAVLIHVKVFFQGGYVETYSVSFAEST